MASRKSKSSSQAERQRRRRMQEARERENRTYQRQSNDHGYHDEDNFWLYEEEKPSQPHRYEDRSRTQKPRTQKDQRSQSAASGNRGSRSRENGRGQQLERDRRRSREQAERRRSKTRSVSRTQGRSSQRENRHRQAHWQVDNPVRLVTVLLVFAVIIVLLITQVISRTSESSDQNQTAEDASILTSDSTLTSDSGTDEVNTEESSVDESSDESVSEESSVSEEESSSSRDELASSISASTALDGVDDQLMAFMSGLMISNVSNYASEPEEEEEDVEEVVYDYTIVLDPAHGGEDTGYTSDDVTESDLNLTLALLIQEFILSEDGSCEVTLTRSDDEYMEAADRISEANDDEADLFISIDCTYDENDASASGLYALYWETDDESGLSEASLAVAETLLETASSVTGLSSNGASTSVSEILYNANMPAVSLCLGYLTNSQDLEILTDSDVQEELAKALAEDIVELVQLYSDTEETADGSETDETEDETTGDQTSGEETE